MKNGSNVGNLLLNGFTTIKFAKHNNKGGIHGKMNQGLKTGKCFLLYDNNVAEIRGILENDELKVIFKFIMNNSRIWQILK